MVAAPAILAQGAALLPGLSVWASVPAGNGVGFPLRIDAGGRYRLELLGLGGPFVERLEDADGWPLLRDGDLGHLEREFRAGDYRLIVEPPAVPARAVARLTRLVSPAPIEGHGRIPCPSMDAVGDVARAGSADAPGPPDSWSFALAGTAHVTLDMTGDGMLAVVARTRRMPSRSGGCAIPAG